MTYYELVSLLADFFLIKVVESSFIVFMVVILSKIEINKDKLLLTIFTSALIGQIFIPFGNYHICDRVIFLIGTVIAIAIFNLNKISTQRMISIFINMFIVISLMMVIEFITFLPFLYFLGDGISIVQKSVFISVLCSIPLRMFEYLICHLTFMKFGGKYEKINRKN